VHPRNELYHTLNIRGTNFIAGWAYWERISSLAEHTRKCLKSNISAESHTIFKNLMIQALGTIRFWFLQKNLKKIHACVPLRNLFYIKLLLKNLLDNGKYARKNVWLTCSKLNWRAAHPRVGRVLWVWESTQGSLSKPFSNVNQEVSACPSVSFYSLSHAIYWLPLWCPFQPDLRCWIVNKSYHVSLRRICTDKKLSPQAACTAK
jgi:hypothetical protein